MSSPPLRGTCLPAAVGLASCATLLFEITLTRIFSVILWYHYGFMVISLALLGLGLSGIFVYLYPERFPRSHAPRQAAIASVAFAASTVAALLLFHLMVSVRTTWPLGTIELVLVFLIMVIPFFFAGLAIAIPLSRFPERIGRLYGADLAGAALGAGLVIPLLALLGGHRTVIVAACLASLAALLFAWAQPDRRSMLGGVVTLAVCVAVLALSGPTDLFHIRYSKHGAESDVIFEKWNSFSRVTVLERPMNRQWGWNVSRKAPNAVKYHRIRIDGGAGTTLLAFDGNFGSLDFLRYDISSLAYQFRPQSNVVIIGAGGGRDILTARSLGVDRIHAVEINPIIVDLVRKDFQEFSHSPYDLPGVTWSVTDGRSYLATSKDTFDHIQLAAVDTIAASAAGALALVEQSLYTTEAFLEYFDHLDEDGILSITRPFNTERIEGTLRMVDLMQTAWLKRGVSSPERHLVVIGSAVDSWGLLLASRRAFSENEIAAIENLCGDLGFGMLYAPGAAENVEEIAEILQPDRKAFLRRFPTNVEATTDDRPFFFYFRKPWSVIQDALSAGSQATTTRARVTPDVLMQLLLFVLVLTLATAFGLPMALGRLKLGAARGSGVTLMYFAGIGLGFMLVEIAFMQRYTLLLGQPVYAFAVILGTMLVWGGTGSFLMHRVQDCRLRRLSRIALGAILGGIAVHVWLMPSVVALAMHWNLPLRLAVTMFTIAPLALVMGVALPSGMRLMERSSPEVLAWAWGVNGSFSVLGAVVAMATSVFFGITTTLILSLAAYGLAFLTPWQPSRE